METCQLMDDLMMGRLVARQMVSTDGRACFPHPHLKGVIRSAKKILSSNISPGLYVYDLGATRMLLQLADICSPLLIAKCIGDSLVS